MGTANALHTHGTGTDGGTDARTARLAQSGLLAAHGPTVFDTRTGVLHGPGSTALLTGTSDTGPMRTQVNPHVPVSSRGATNGAYLGPGLTAAVKVDHAAAPGSGTRIDVVYFKQQDATAGVPSPDASYAPLYGVVTGTVGAGKPSLSGVVGAVELGTVTIPAAVTNTLAAGVVITPTALQVVARGAPIPVRTQAERDAITKYPFLTVQRLDLGTVEMVKADGVTWVTVFDPTSADPRPYLHAVLGGAHNLANGSWEDVPVDTELSDTAGWHGSGGYPSNVLATVNRTGWYRVTGGVAFGAHATGVRGVRLVRNGGAGVSGLGAGSLVRGSGLVIPTSGLGVITSVVTPQRRIQLNSGDTIKVQGFQNSGAALALRPLTAGAEEQVSFLEVEWDRA